MIELTASTPAEARYCDFSRDVDSQGIVRDIASGRLEDVLKAALAWPEHLHHRIHVWAGEIETVEWFGEMRQRERPSYPLTELVVLSPLQVN